MKEDSGRRSANYYLKSIGAIANIIERLVGRVKTGRRGLTL